LYCLQRENGFRKNWWVGKIRCLFGIQEISYSIPTTQKVTGNFEGVQVLKSQNVQLKSGISAGVHMEYFQEQHIIMCRNSSTIQKML